MLLGTSLAEVVKPGEDFWYLDEANVLSEATEGEIFFANQRLIDACGAEIAVVTIETTGSMSISDYAYTLFNEWEIGGESYRGMLILLAVGDDDYFTMPGTNMSLYFDSATLSDMQYEYLEPNFAAKDYDRGVKRYFEAVYSKLIDELNLNLSIDDAIADYNAYAFETGAQTAKEQTADRNFDRADEKGGNVSGKLILIAVLLVILVIVMSRRSGNKTTRTHSAHSGFGSAARVHTSPVRSSGSGMQFGLGYLLGRMANTRTTSARTVPPRPARPVSGPQSPRTGGFGGANRSGFGGPSVRSGRSTTGFGASRQTRPMSSSVMRSGFGGAKRSGGASRGPSTRGGGAGRRSR